MDMLANLWGYATHITELNYMLIAEQALSTEVPAVAGWAVVGGGILYTLFECYLAIFEPKN